MIGPAADLNWIPLGRLLVEARVLTTAQLEQALAVKETTGGRLGEIVVDLGLASEHAIACALSAQYELEFVDLDEVQLDSAAVAQLPEALARRYEALPIRFLSDGVLLLAVSDPTNVSTADDLRLALGRSFRLAVAGRAQIERAIARAHRPSLQLLPETEARAGGASDARPAATRDLSSSEPTINLVNTLLTEALGQGASDIHLEPGEHGLRVRIRVDGTLRELTTVPAHLQPAVASRLKSLGRLDLASRSGPQVGRVSTSFGGDPIDLRVAALPTPHGEHVVLTILTRPERAPRLVDLELTPAVEEVFRTAIEQPDGAVIVCGPARSGRTTTLYGALDHLNGPQRAVMTIEDPVEHRLEGVNHIEVDAANGLTYAAGLDTIIRSDPDVVLVGEIGDRETAAGAIDAALTGRLVLSTLAAPTAAGAIVRLRELGVDPARIACALNCVVAQRMARRLCVHCRVPAPTPDESPAFVAAGCEHCRDTGHSGRVAIREVVPVQGELRQLVERSTEELFAAAVRGGMTTMRDDGLRLAAAGVVSLAELRRVTGLRLT